MKRLLFALFFFLPFDADAMEHKVSLSKIKAHYIKIKDQRGILVKMAMQTMDMKESAEKKECIAELRGAMEDFLKRTKKGIKRCAGTQIKYVIRYNAEASVIQSIMKLHLS